MNNIRGLRSTLTLDLQGNRSKKSKCNTGLNDTSLLSTPDLPPSYMLESPEVRRMLNDCSTMDLLTPTPNTIRFFTGPSGMSSGFHDPSSSSSHLEMISQLKEESNTSDLDQQDDSNLDTNDYEYANQYSTPPMGSNYSSIEESSPLTPLSVKIKEEPQTVPSVVMSPSVSPINMNIQEKMKADRKKERNREAAAKCRKKKLDRIASLEAKFKDLKGVCDELGHQQASLNKELRSLKEHVVSHYNKGCPIVIPSGEPLY